MKNPKAKWKPHPPKARDQRSRALAEWRGIDLTDAETAARASARALSQVMPGVLTHLGLDRRRAETEVLKVWNHLIDPNIIAHAQPTGLHKGTLFVTVDNSAWLSEIVRYRSREILERLQHSFGKDLIARISYRAG
jgi:predicted nucleic acid-binding Zn ribbon protein